MKTRLYAALITMGLLATSALAQEEKVIKEADRVVYNKETELDFSDVLVNGELIKPNAAYIKNLRKTSFEVLIELRANFRPELLETMSSL